MVSLNLISFFIFFISPKIFFIFFMQLRVLNVSSKLHFKVDICDIIIIFELFSSKLFNKLENFELLFKPNCIFSISKKGLKLSRSIKLN